MWHGFRYPVGPAGLGSVPVAVLHAKRNRLRIRCIPFTILGLGAVLRC